MSKLEELLKVEERERNFKVDNLKWFGFGKVTIDGIERDTVVQFESEKGNITHQFESNKIGYTLNNRFSFSCNIKPVNNKWFTALVIDEKDGKLPEHLQTLNDYVNGIEPVKDEFERLNVIIGKVKDGNGKFRSRNCGTTINHIKIEYLTNEEIVQILSDRLEHRELCDDKFSTVKVLYYACDILSEERFADYFGIYKLADNIALLKQLKENIQVNFKPNKGDK